MELGETKVSDIATKEGGDKGLQKEAAQLKPLSSQGLVLYVLSRGGCTSVCGRPGARLSALGQRPSNSPGSDTGRVNERFERDMQAHIHSDRTTE